MESADLCIPIYLNQRIVFDLLAVIENGFSRMSTIKTSTTEAETSKSDLGASIGVSNVFALLGVSFKGERGTEKDTEAETEVSKEKVHTPTSLFSKLRQQLRQKRLLTEIWDDCSINDLMSGQFVEFRAILRKNPLIDTMEALVEIMNMASLFSAKEIGPTKRKHMKEGHRQDPNQLIIQQMRGVLDALTGSNSMELIGEILGSSSIKAVLSTELGYFNDRSVSEIIDGEFRVLGKVVRVVTPESGEVINLLRKTTFSRLPRKIFDEMADGLTEAKEVGITFPEFVTEIEGPAVQVIPIAIFA